MNIDKVCSDYYMYGIASDKQAIINEWAFTYQNWLRQKVEVPEVYSKYMYLENALISKTSDNPESLEIEPKELSFLAHYFTSENVEYNDKSSFFHLIPQVRTLKISKQHLETLAQISISETDNGQRNRALAAFLNYFPHITYFEQSKHANSIELFKKVCDGLYIRKNPETFRPFFDVLTPDSLINIVRTVNHIYPEINWRKPIQKGGQDILLLEYLCGSLFQRGLQLKYSELKKELNLPKLTKQEEMPYIKSIIAGFSKEDDIISELRTVSPSALSFSLKEPYIKTDLSQLLLNNGSWRILSKFHDKYTLDELYCSKTTTSKVGSKNTAKAIDSLIENCTDGIKKGNLKYFCKNLFKGQSLSFPNLLQKMIDENQYKDATFQTKTITKIWELLGEEKVILQKPLNDFDKSRLLPHAIVRKAFQVTTPSEWMERNSHGIPIIKFIIGLAFHEHKAMFNFPYLYNEDKLIIRSFSLFDSAFQMPITGLQSLDLLEEREVVYNIHKNLSDVFEIWKANESNQIKNKTVSYSSSLESLDFLQTLLLNLPFSTELSADYVETQQTILSMAQFIKNSDYAFSSYGQSREESLKESLKPFDEKGILLEHKIMKQLVTSSMAKAKVNKF